MTLPFHYSPSVFILTPAPRCPVSFPRGDRERQTLLFTHGSRGLWLPISKPVWVNIWYIPWTNYLSERTLSLLSNPSPFPSGSQAGRYPLGGSARSHIGETFLKAFPVLLASRQAVTFLPSCVFHKHTRGPKGQQGSVLPVCQHAWLGLGAAGLVQVVTLMRSIMSVQPVVIIWLHSIQDTGVLMRFNRLPGLNRATSIWILSQTNEDTVVEFPSLCFCYSVPVYESILALDSTEHTCWGECQAREHLLWSVAVGKLFHFDKMACGNTMA